ncbi:MAG TPA: CHASE2 domain-containing protein, partial [Phycisphaerales bacterium]|nr:CHASE2 domain-containing protein [Phycisphaerales bacterium]
MKALRRSLVCLGVGVAAATAAWLIHKAGWLDRPELVTWDVRERWLGAAAPSDVPIKLILIDQSSLDWAREQAGSPWPWPREFYTKIIDFCKAGNAKAIAFDLFFSEPSMFGQDDDNRFAEALKSTRATVLAVPPGPHLSQPAGWPEGIPPSPFQITGLEQWIRSHPQADLSLNSAVMSLPEISENASLLGHVRADQDADSIIRRLAPIVTFDGQVLPALSLAAFEVSQVSDRARIPEFQVTENSLVFDGHAIPLDHEGLAVLRYRKPTLRGDQRRMYEAFSAAGIINSQLAIEERKTPQVSPEVFKDCYVFIGTSAAGTYDLKPTPVNKAGPGVEVQAAFLDNLLYNGFIHSSNPAWTILFTLILSIIAVFATRESRNSFHVVSAFVLMLPAPWLTGFVAYTSGWQWPIVLPEVGVC